MNGNQTIKTILASLLMAGWTAFSMTASAGTDEQEERSESYYLSKGYQTFKSVGFAIKAPCVLKDISAKDEGDFYLNYGGTVNDSDPKTLAFYQVLASQLPAGYRSDPDWKRKIEANLAQGGKKKVIFGYQGYTGFVMDAVTDNGYRQKGIFFIKDNFIIALTVISNDRLEERFNSFTNSYREFSASGTGSAPGSSSGPARSSVPGSAGRTDSASSISLHTVTLPFGYSVSVPCNLETDNIPGQDYSYIGVVGEEDENTGIVYSIMARRLTEAFSRKAQSEKERLLESMRKYAAASATQYEKIAVGIPNYMAYRMVSRKGDFKLYRCLILTEYYTIELGVASKLDKAGDFGKFLESLKKTGN